MGHALGPSIRIKGSRGDSRAVGVVARVAKRIGARGRHWRRRRRGNVKLELGSDRLGELLGIVGKLGQTRRNGMTLALKLGLSKGLSLPAELSALATAKQHSERLATLRRRFHISDWRGEKRKEGGCEISRV